MSATCSSSTSRLDKDIKKLIENKYELEILGSSKEMRVTFIGPEGTPYRGGIWQVLVMVPDEYPYRPPAIAFKNPIYHPNIDEISGAVCMDVLQNTWSPLYDFCTVFDIFLPQLLCYPNATDALNKHAGATYQKNIEEFNNIVAEYIRNFASKKKRSEKSERPQQTRGRSALADIVEETSL